MDNRTTIRDPKPAVERIEVLAGRIKDGDILLPKFQRDFIWEREQIIDLFDSIAKNYPIGSVLLWLSKNKLHSERSVADLEIADRPPEYPVNYLLDGQQRLSSICGALFWDGKNKDSVWNVAYDLRSQEFLHLTTLDDPPLHQIRMNKLSDAASFFKHVASLETLSAEDKDELRSRAELLFNRFKDYTIATVTLSDMPIESVAPIFERINSTGTRLTIVDLMRAATWSEEFDLIDTIDGEVLDAVSGKGFGTIDRKAVLRNLSAASGGAFSAESIDDLRNKSPGELKAAAGAVVAAYERATDFLKDEIGAPNSEILPYANQIVVLAELFRLLPTPDAGQFAAVKRWFWRTTFSGYFSGWNTGQMSSDLSAVRSFVEGKTIELEVGAIQPTDSVWLTRQFRTNNAHAKMLGLMLSHKGARDLITGQKVPLEKALSWSNSREFHHLFPQAMLRQLKFDSRQINSIANFVLLTSASNKTISARPPSEYLAESLATLGDEFTQVAEANLMSKDAVNAALHDDFEKFLAARASSLQAHALFLCGW